MKRYDFKFLFLILTLAIIAAFIGLRASAQDAATLAAQAEDKRAAEERYKQMNDDIQSLLKTQEVQQKRLQNMADELRRSREENSTSGKNYVTREELRDQLKEIIEKIQEVDRKREDDKKLILNEIDKLGKLLQTPPPVRKSEKSEKPDREPKNGDTAKAQKNSNTEPELFPHKVEKGENLMKILAAYNKQLKEDGKKLVTVDMVKAANPDINVDKLLVGQKILIPVSAK